MKNKIILFALITSSSLSFGMESGSDSESKLSKHRDLIVRDASGAVRTSSKIKRGIHDSCYGVNPMIGVNSMITYGTAGAEERFSLVTSTPEYKLAKAHHDLKLQEVNYQKEKALADLAYMQKLNRSREVLFFTAGGAFLTGVCAALYAVAKIPGLSEKISKKLS